MQEIVILSKETYDYLNSTIKQCFDWLQTDARYSHSQSKIRVVENNVRHTLRMINHDMELYRDNCKILTEELNKRAGSNEPR